MASVPNSKNPVAPLPQYTPLPALLSYLVPGLGQMVQGRVGKGVLFFVSLYGLFFYGLFLGRGEAAVLNPNQRGGSEHPHKYVLNNNVYLPTARDRNDSGTTNNALSALASDLYNRPQFLGQFWMGMVVWPAIVQYNFVEPNTPHPLFGTFMRTPKIEDLNAVHTSRDKLIDLGWVYTVIAGVLNILVIYDALAGPAFLPTRKTNPNPV
jgi:hypothetical protein